MSHLHESNNIWVLFVFSKNKNINTWNECAFEQLNNCVHLTDAIKLLYTFSREMFFYMAFVKKHTQISFCNCACNAFKIVNKIYTDEV